MKLKHKIFSILIISTLGACTTSMDMTSNNFGHAVDHNAAVQHVEPTEAQKQNTFIRPDPQRSSLAREKYKTDEVETPVDLRTTTD